MTSSSQICERNMRTPNGALFERSRSASGIHHKANLVAKSHRTPRCRESRFGGRGRRRTPRVKQHVVLLGERHKYENRRGAPTNALDAESRERGPQPLLGRARVAD
ncbi:hypothetical protein HPB47_024489 [Ixodes persulcatus]|uniref:Uncharacterized protein n=1 Tax=Ixodes persulcatus TaxID=34615 RepID=A0AC60Q6H7_IXOPE|nr:hypothetical protein HPB47_024489 [Ixodes persulcatus]